MFNTREFLKCISDDSGINTSKKRNCSCSKSILYVVVTDYFKLILATDLMNYSIFISDYDIAIVYICPKVKLFCSAKWY